MSDSNTNHFPLTPEEIQRLSEPSEQEIDEAIARVNQLLTTQVKNGNGSVRAGIAISKKDLGPRSNVRNAVISRYKQSGWSVQWNSDRTDGAYDFCSFYMPF